VQIKPHLSLPELKRIERAEKDADRVRRLRIVILGIEGWTAPAIAMAVGLSRRICQRWAARYNDEGLQGLDDRRGNQAGLPLNPEQQAEFQAGIEDDPTPEDTVCALRGKDLQRILEREFQLLRSLSSVYWLLHKLGYSSLAPRPKHPRSDPEAVALFKATWHETLREIARRHPGKRLRVYFQDESRFGQQGTLTRRWAKTGSRPTAVRQTEYQYLWVTASVCPETGYAEGLLSPKMNTATINRFLALFSASIPSGEQAVMVWAGAGFHTSKSLRMPENITPVRLPPYSPELNPIENLWHHLKSHFWSNRSYQGAEDLERAALAAWQAAVLDESLMKTVCSAPYAKRATSD
jgi:transposase